MVDHKQVRTYYLGGFFLTIILLSLTFALQFYTGVMPCTLCILQRGIFVAISGLFLIGWLFYLKPFWQKILNGFGTCTSFIGIIFAARQVWLQHYPVTGLGDCTVSLRYLFRIFSVTDALKQIWHGGTECSEQGWRFLSLSMAEWSLFWFIAFFLLFILQIKRAYQ